MSIYKRTKKSVSGCMHCDAVCFCNVGNV